MDLASPSSPGPSFTVPVCSCVGDLMQRINKLRRRQFAIDADGFTVVSAQDRHVWTRMFAEHFLVNAHCTIPQCSAHSDDDMRWYVRHLTHAGTPRHDGFYIGGGGFKSPLEVYRRQSKKQPMPGDNTVNWEETVYLNFLMQQVDFQVTCAVCTKTSPQNLQILRKNCQNVYPSPSRRQMANKGESEEITYPNIYFAIDNFDQVFSDMVIRDGECVCVELVARDRYRNREAAVFLGSIRYEVLKQVFDTRASNTWQWAQKLMAGAGSGGRREFVRMRGPHGKGYAEMAVARVPGSGLDTPGVPNADNPFDDFEAHTAANEYNHRRMSDTNLASKYWKGPPVKKSHSEADYVNQYPEVEANSIDDELEEGVFSRLWSVRGFGQAWHWLREKRRAASTPLNAYLTYVTLPLNSILDDLLETSRRPILSFGCDEERVQT